MKSFIFLILCIFCIAYANNKPNLIPYPQSISFENNVESVHPCAINYKFTSQSFLDGIPNYYFQMLDFFYQSTFPEFQCRYEKNGKTYKSQLNHHKERTLKVVVINVVADAPLSNRYTEESYTLDLVDNDWVLQADNYVGFLRGVETFLQLLEQSDGCDEYQINYYPLHISDTPSLKHRGVMIDTARHFMRLSTLKHVLDGMLFHKLNVLHWHITDEESFPLQLDSYPNLTKYGAYSEKKIYSKEDVAEIIEYAKVRGIRVIPEIDSPAHSLSWGFSEELSDIAMRCPIWALYNGQLNPSLNKTYDVVQGVMNDIVNLFPDDMVHLGGDEVSFGCWENDTNIKEFMDWNNIPNGIKLQQYFKDRQRTLLDSQKSAIYWVNDANFQYSPTDIMQFWSSVDQYSLIQNYSNSVILSPYDYLYIDLGYGNVFGDKSWAPFVTWKRIYSFNPFPVEIPKWRILGAEVTLWAELNSDETMDNHLWSRTSAFAERVWNAEINNGNQDIVTRLYANEKLLLRRGFDVSPVTSEYCSNHVDICFPDD